MIRRPLVVPELMLRIHSPNRSEIANEITIAPGSVAGLPSALRFVFLCFTNRCGSAYLGDILRATDFFEQPGESLNSGDVLALCRSEGIRSFADYFAHVVRRDARNNTYMVKVAPEQIVLLVESGILGQIAERSDFLLLNRADKLAQAISRSIAEQNNRWAWDSPSEFPDDKLVYSAKGIAQHLYDITILNMSFQQFFGVNGIVPIDVEYERLVSNPQLELDAIVRGLGLAALRIDPGKLRVRRQANEINLAWRSRFLQETEAPHGCTVGPSVMPELAPIVAPPPPPAIPVPAVAADVVAHIRNVGDVAGACGAWLGAPQGGLWIEGFSITPHQGITPADIEYHGVQDFGRALPWTQGGGFCGSRGMTVPLRGLCVRLRNAAAETYQCAFSGRFQDGSTIGPVPGGRVCQSASLAPLEAFQIVISPRSP